MRNIFFYEKDGRVSGLKKIMTVILLGLIWLISGCDQEKVLVADNGEELTSSEIELYDSDMLLDIAANQGYWSISIPKTIGLISALTKTDDGTVVESSYSDDEFSVETVVDKNNSTFSSILEFNLVNRIGIVQIEGILSDDNNTILSTHLSFIGNYIVYSANGSIYFIKEGSEIDISKIIVENNEIVSYVVKMTIEIDASSKGDQVKTKDLIVLYEFVAGEFKYTMLSGKQSLSDLTTFYEVDTTKVNSIIKLPNMYGFYASGEQHITNDKYGEMEIRIESIDELLVSVNEGKLKGTLNYK